MTERDNGPIKFEIVKHFGVLSTAQTGWTKEFNLVKWNDRPEKYDIRDWAPGHERMSKGVTLYDYEMKKIADLCAGLFNGTSDNKPAVEIPPAESVHNETQAVTAEQKPAVDSAQAAVQEQPAADKVAEEEIPF